MSETIGYIIISIGVLFDLLGCIGLVRLPDVYNRLQAGTKCVTLGTCLILIGAAIVTPSGAAAVKCILCAIFVLLTSPVGAHAIARAAHRSGVPLWEDSVIDRYADDNEGSAAADEKVEE